MTELEGRAFENATEEELRNALEQAFDYRGDVTLTKRDGTRVEGYIFDRRTASTLQESAVRLIPKNEDVKVSVSYADISGLAFTGRDTAAGKSWEAWVKKYWERKQAGETAIALEPDSLE